MQVHIKPSFGVQPYGEQSAGAILERMTEHEDLPSKPTMAPRPTGTYEVTSWGAGLTALYAPLAPGETSPTNILLSLPSPGMYRTHTHPYFHSTIGRVANRIADARINDLNGRDYRLAANNGGNTNHGGDVGWDKREWTDCGVKLRGYDNSVGDDVDIKWESSADEGDGRRDVRLFTLTSPDGDEGFPGTVEARCWYAAGRGSKGETVVEVEWEAELVDDHGHEGLQTPVCMTNHAYFNLNPVKSSTAEKTLANHNAKLATSRHLPFLTDNPGIPEGRFEDFPGIPKVPFASFPLDPEDDGDVMDVDHCFVLDEEAGSIPLDTRKWPLQTLAELHGNESGIHLMVESTEPAFQFYTGKWVNVAGWDAGEDEEGRKWEKCDGYKPFAGCCIEPSRYVNAAGRKPWRSMVMLEKGKLYGAKTRYVISRTKV